MKILPTITTGFSGWQEKIEEIKELRLKEIALFPTFLKQEERKNFTRL